MQEAVAAPLVGWENFYVIIGSAAAALTGLQFVVITLIAGLHGQRSDESVAAFGTPTVVHFGAALLVAALLNAPWQVLWPISLLLGLCGVGGILYIVVVIRRARRQTTYQPVLEDWLWHVVFPLASYVALFVTAILLPVIPVTVLFITGAATVLFLFIGIHNAWDTVTYLTLGNSSSEDGNQDENSSSA